MKPFYKSVCILLLLLNGTGYAEDDLFYKGSQISDVRAGNEFMAMFTNFRCFRLACSMGNKQYAKAIEK